MLTTYFVCDRCGAAAAPDSIGGVPFAPHGWTEQANGLDLCPECVREALAPTRRLCEAVGYTRGGDRYACTARSMRSAVQRLTCLAPQDSFERVLLKRMPISELRQGHEGRTP